MHSDLIYKLQLVTSAGLNLAEVPESEDQTKSQLSGGIMSAILTFSREVHNREIQSMSYHDRNIVFIPLSDVFIVVEISATVDKQLLNKFVDLFKLRAAVHFEGIESDNLDVPLAVSILDQIYKSEWLHSALVELGFEKSIQNATSYVYYIDHSKGEITNLVDYPTYLDEIANMIHEKNVKGKIDDPYTCGFIMLPRSAKAVFVVSKNQNTVSGVGVIEVGENKSQSLFRMTPYLIKNVMQHENKNSEDLQTIIDELKETHDIDTSLQRQHTEHINSVRFLSEVIKNVDRALFSVVSGNQVVVVGERNLVDKVIDLLMLFNQHLISDIIHYFEGGSTISNDITGMSKEDCDRLRNEGVLDESVTIIDLNSGRIQGTHAKSNKFLRNLYERIKNLRTTQASEVIYQELQLLTSYAMSATAFAVYSKKDALKRLGELKSSIDDNDQYEIIQLLATKQNKWLAAVVYDKTIDADWI